MAASHLVPNTFSPQTFVSPQLIPKNKQSHLIWSTQTNGSQDNGPLAQTVLTHLVPMGKWFPRQLVLLDNWSPKFIPASPHKTTYFQVLPSKGFLVLPSAFNGFLILPSAFQCFLVHQNFFKWKQVELYRAFWYFQVLPSASKFFLVLISAS